MVITTNSPKVRETRRINVELIMSQHECHCAYCIRSGNCTCRRFVGINGIPFHTDIPNNKWSTVFPLVRDNAKCVKCMRCIQVYKIQGMNIWDVANTGSYTRVDVKGNIKIDKSDCALCGQSSHALPCKCAQKERDDTGKVRAALADPDKITVVQIAPSVRTACGRKSGSFA